MAFAIDEHIRESGSSGDPSSRTAQLELLRVRVDTLRHNHSSAKVRHVCSNPKNGKRVLAFADQPYATQTQTQQSRYNRAAFAPLPPSNDDTAWM